MQRFSFREIIPDADWLIAPVGQTARQSGRLHWLQVNTE
jgi:hypothetical protein